MPGNQTFHSRLAARTITIKTYNQTALAGIGTALFSTAMNFRETTLLKTHRYRHQLVRCRNHSFKLIQAESPGGHRVELELTAFRESLVPRANSAL